MGEELTIREFHEEDADRVLEIHKDTVRSINSDNYSGPEIDAWTDAAEGITEKTEESYLIVVAKDGVIVGFGELLDGEIRAMYVDKKHHGEGIGTALLHNLEEKAHQESLETLELESTISARGFYEKHGYEFVEETTHQFGDQELDVFKMEKKLG